MEWVKKGELPVWKFPTDKLLVSEIFGPTIQGEGPTVFHSCAFLRLTGCNLNCTWCDTKYAWELGVVDFGFLHQYSPSEIAKILKIMPIKRLVITGGEPLLQQEKLHSLLREVKGWGWEIEVETNGTLEPDGTALGLIDQFNVSPKLSNSGVPHQVAIRPEILQYIDTMARLVNFKFVVADLSDLDEVDKIVSSLYLKPTHGIYIMPEGTTPEVILERSRVLVSEVIRRGWNLTTRAQILLWGNKRGR